MGRFSFAFRCAGVLFRHLPGSRHYTGYERHFFELAGTLAVKVEFIVSETEAEKLLEVVARTQRAIFYTIAPARFGILNAEEPSARV